MFHAPTWLSQAVLIWRDNRCSPPEKDRKTPLRKRRKDSRFKRFRFGGEKPHSLRHLFLVTCPGGGNSLLCWGRSPDRVGGSTCPYGVSLSNRGHATGRHGQPDLMGGFCRYFPLPCPVLTNRVRTGSFNWGANRMVNDDTVSAATLDEAEGSTGRAMRVSRVLRNKGVEEFVKPGRLVEVRFVKGQSLSLTASRLLALMILTAGGDAWRAVTHRMRKVDIRRGHKSNERIVDMLEELHRTLFAEDDRSWRGNKATRRFALIQMSREEAEDDDGTDAGWIEWEFTPDARRLIQESETYAVLNRQAVLGFRSSYALRLYEMGALRIHRRQPVWRGDMAALRAALGISPDVYKDFAQLRRKVLDVSRAEIDQLAHFKVEWREIRQGRTVTELEFRFLPKDAPQQLSTVDELARHSLGRAARRDGRDETVVEDETGFPPLPPLSERLLKEVVKPEVRVPASPATKPDGFPLGSLEYDAIDDFFRIGRLHGGGWDIDKIADAYRIQMGDRLKKLSGQKLRSSWTGFCESWAARRGSP